MSTSRLPPPGSLGHSHRGHKYLLCRSSERLSSPPCNRHKGTGQCGPSTDRWMCCVRGRVQAHCCHASLLGLKRLLSTKYCKHWAKRECFVALTASQSTAHILGKPVKCISSSHNYRHPSVNKILWTFQWNRIHSNVSDLGSELLPAYRENNEHKASFFWSCHLHLTVFVSVFGSVSCHGDASIVIIPYLVHLMTTGPSPWQLSKLHLQTKAISCSWRVWKMLVSEFWVKKNVA